MAGDRAQRQAIYGFPWTASTSGWTGLSLHSRDQLLALRDIFLDIDTAIASDGRRYIRWCQGSQSIKDKAMVTSTELDKLDEMIAEEQLKTKSESPNELVARYFERPNLTRGNDVWRAVATSHLHYQGTPTAFETHPGWSIAKERALKYLDLRQESQEIMASLDAEMKSLRLAPLCRDIAVKISCLNSFEKVYNKQPVSKRLSSDGGLWREPTYEEVLESRQKSKELNLTFAYNQSQQDRNATLIAVVFTTTLLSFIPTIFAWNRTKNIPGTKDDVDFYLLLQNSSMQLLGLFTAMWPIWRHSSAHAWKWAQVFTITGAGCAIVSPFLYVFTPTMWSTLVSFFGTAAQAGMAALLAMMFDGVGIGVKRE